MNDNLSGFVTRIDWSSEIEKLIADYKIYPPGGLFIGYGYLKEFYGPTLLIRYEVFPVDEPLYVVHRSLQLYLKAILYSRGSFVTHDLKYFKFNFIPIGLEDGAKYLNPPCRSSQSEMP